MEMIILIVRAVKSNYSSHIQKVQFVLLVEAVIRKSF